MFKVCSLDARVRRYQFIGEATLTSVPMTRKRKNISLDEPILESIERLWRQSGAKSFSLYVESLLAAHAVANNQLDPNYAPPGETRGGHRSETK